MQLFFAKFENSCNFLSIFDKDFEYKHKAAVAPKLRQAKPINFATQHVKHRNLSLLNIILWYNLNLMMPKRISTNVQHLLLCILR